MSFKIILRTNNHPNLFREWMLKALRCPDINNVLICSGFFQENFKNCNFALSQDSTFVRALKGKNVITLGVHNYGWIKSYKKFVKELMVQGISVLAFRSKRLRWHSKIFIAFSEDKPVFAIVGSSNMTRSAFGSPVLSLREFNNEADVVFWNSKNKKINDYFIKNQNKEKQLKNQINLTYQLVNNPGITIEKRLEDLSELLSTTNDHLEYLFTNES